MATVTSEEPSTNVIEHRLYEMTTDEFFKMIEAQVFDPHRRIYLWHGRLCEAMSKTAAHAQLANLFNKAIARRLPEGWFVSAENPLALNLQDAPLPDFTVVAGEPMTFLQENRHVEPADVAIVVEVSVTSLPRDMGDRRSQYALAMMRTGGTYLVIDHGGRRFWVHEEPGVDATDASMGVWNKVTQVGPGQLICLFLGGQALEPIPWEEVMR